MFFLRMVLIFISMGLISVPANANLQQQMDSMFGSLVNATNPQAYLGQRTGAFFGGSLYVRNKIVNSNMIGFVPPHVSAGCGGIDMFGGSFSFINASQFKNLLRSIASNAQGYFFQLALTSMCPTCMQNMSKLQTSVQKLNQLASNSCKVGTALVDAAAVSIAPGQFDSSSVARKTVENASKEVVAVGTSFSDTFDAFFGSSDQNNAARISQTAPTFLKDREYTGNIAWQLINDSSVGSWMSFGDQATKEAIMSITGTIIIQEPTKTINKPGGGTDKTISSDVYSELLLTPEALVSGGKNQTIEIYVCDEPIRCMGPKKKKLTGFVDLQTKIERILIGDGTGNKGLVYKFAHPLAGMQQTAQEKAFIENMPLPISSMIRNLAQRGEKAAEVLIRQISPWIAREMAYRYTLEMITAMRIAAAQAKPNLKDKSNNFLKVLVESVQPRIFQMKKSNMDTDLSYMHAIEIYQSTRIQTVGRRRMSTRLKSDSNPARQ